MRGVVGPSRLIRRAVQKRCHWYIQRGGLSFGNSQNVYIVRTLSEKFFGIVDDTDNQLAKEKMKSGAKMRSIM